MKNKKWGGVREGAGRKSTAEDGIPRNIKINIRASESEKAEYNKLLKKIEKGTSIEKIIRALKALVETEK